MLFIYFVRRKKLRMVGLVSNFYKKTGTSTESSQVALQ